MSAPPRPAGPMPFGAGRERVALARIAPAAGDLVRVPAGADLADHDSAPRFGHRYVEQLWRLYAAKAARLGLDGPDRRS